MAVLVKSKDGHTRQMRVLISKTGCKRTERRLSNGIVEIELGEELFVRVEVQYGEVVWAELRTKPGEAAMNLVKTLGEKVGL